MSILRQFSETNEFIICVQSNQKSHNHLFIYTSGYTYTYINPR